MPYFIAIQYPYQSLSITLAHNQTILASQEITKFEALSLTIPTIQSLLTKHAITLADLAAIAINNGPGPFNTLRSIIATANACAFAHNIPLIACNGLSLLMQEVTEQQTVALLDAFGCDVYYAFKSNNKEGYDSIENIIATCNSLYKNETVNFIGNGALKHKELITKNFSGTAVFHDKISFASEQTFINEAYKKYTHHETENELYPLYFSSPVTK